MPVKEAEKEDEAENEPNRKVGKEETIGAPSSQPVEYYKKHRINEKLIEGLVDNHRFNDSLSGAQDPVNTSLHTIVHEIELEMRKKD
ncbi:hypothetical protein Tco_0812689 [Tanacetum coccineum]